MFIRPSQHPASASNRQYVADRMAANKSPVGDWTGTRLECRNERCDWSRATVLRLFRHLFSGLDNSDSVIFRYQND